jgi:hypothetical protein
MTTQATAPGESQTDVFLKYAPERSIAITGTLATGNTGGSSGNITWQALPPETPVWCASVDFENTSTVIAVVVPITQAFTISPYAPYSAWSQMFAIAGANPWPLTECTPWMFDNTTETRDYDDSYPGLGNSVTAGTGVADYLNNSNVIDQGPAAPNFLSAAVAPGVTTTNVGTASATFTLTWSYNIHIQLKRLARKLWGAIPLGDPKNRLSTQFQLNPIVGNNPEQNFIVSAGAGVTASTSGTTTITANYNVRDIDILPKGVATPSPTVGLGLTMNATSVTIASANLVVPFQHTDAMAYTAIHHLLINNQLPIRPDYMGLWLTQEQKSARYDYDSVANTLAEYWLKYHRTYHRYPYKGHFLVDLARGGFPDIPSVTPYNAIMSPDESYAAMFGIASTPSMQTAMRIATGTSLTNAYARLYEIGLVKVPY